MTNSTASGCRRPADATHDLLTTQLRDGVLVLAGEIDVSTASGLAAALRPLIAAGSPVRINAHDVTFMGSEGLHLLHDTAGELTGDDRVILLDPSHIVLRAIEVIGLGESIEIVAPTHRGA